MSSAKSISTDNGPIILLGRGGSGTRLLTEFARSFGIFVGSKTNISGDSIEWVDALYELAIEEISTGIAAESIRDFYWRERLCTLASEILTFAGHGEGKPWGWKLPETILAIGPILRTFPGARVIHLVRHPVTSALRRTHMTSRIDNCLGRVVVPAAYRACGLDPEVLVQDEAYIHNATTWSFQISRALNILRDTKACTLQLRYEDICLHPRAVQERMADFLALPILMDIAEVDLSRTNRIVDFDFRAHRVWEICGETAQRLGYDLPTLLV